MRYFLGIQPPSALIESVRSFRGELGWQGMEPHITVKAPCGLDGEPTWLPAVRKLCECFAPFSIEVGGIGHFGNTTLFLRISSPDLGRLHASLLSKLAISNANQEACFEGVRYTPHLTLTQYSRTQDQRSITKEVARATQCFNQPIVFAATELVVYGKAGEDTFAVIDKISFTGGAVAH
jgi:2'-5' RNA ligase